jgi:hypothetical protein
MATGYPGLGLMAGYVDTCFPGEDWAVVAHHHLERATRGAETAAPLSIGLYTGLCGLAFTSWYLSYGGTRYQRLLTQLEEVLVPQVLVLAETLVRQRRGTPVIQFDLISGLTGVGAYLLCRRKVPGIRIALEAVLSSLVAVSEIDAGLPRWHTPPHLMDDATLLNLYPAGNLNCGLAHGIPGPLALLALAYRSGVQVDGQTLAIARIADWLAVHRLDDEWGVNWPAAVPLRAGLGPGPSRTAWCYGSPGVARALWYAGVALDQPRYCDLAVAAMEAINRRPVGARYLDSPTFCHGVAGLLQIMLRFAHDTGRADFVTAAQTLGAQLLGQYEPDSLFGFRNIERDGYRVDHPGLLTGAPGVALVLLAAATSTEPTWDRLFLLS